MLKISQSKIPLFELSTLWLKEIFFLLFLLVDSAGGLLRPE